MCGIIGFLGINKNSFNILLNGLKQYDVKVGIALNPETSLSTIDNILNEKLVNYLLIMTVEPGFSGQSFHMECLDKIGLVHTKYPELDIQVDGGINLKTYQLCLEKGANIFVSGSTIFKHNNPKELISKLKGISSKT